MELANDDGDLYYESCRIVRSGGLLKVLQASVLPPQAGEPGLVVALPPGGPAPVGVVTGEGVLGLLRVQMEGRRAMAAEEFLRGARGFVGARLPS